MFRSLKKIIEHIRRAVTKIEAAGYKHGVGGNQTAIDFFCFIFLCFPVKVAKADLYSSPLLSHSPVLGSDLGVSGNSGHERMKISRI